MGKYGGLAAGEKPTDRQTEGSITATYSRQHWLFHFRPTHAHALVKYARHSNASHFDVGQEEGEIGQGRRKKEGGGASGQRTSERAREKVIIFRSQASLAPTERRPNLIASICRTSLSPKSFPSMKHFLLRMVHWNK